MLRVDEQFVFDQITSWGGMAEVEEAVELIKAYREKTWYASKQVIIDNWEIDHSRIYEFVISVFTATLTNDYLTYQAIVGMLNHKIKLEDEVSRIRITADLIGLISLTGLIDIESTQGEYHNISTEYELDSEIPCENKHKTITLRPQPVESNWDHNNGTGSIILGHRMNHHEENVRLSHINRMNKIAFRLDDEFINGFEEMPKEEDPEDFEKSENWKQFKQESTDIYEELIQGGNKFNLMHKYCKRGRQYADSYHINYQGSSFKKAIVQLYNKEIVTR